MALPNDSRSKTPVQACRQVELVLSSAVIERAASPPSRQQKLVGAGPWVGLVGVARGGADHGLGSYAVLASYQPRASIVPAALDLTECPYAWPFCKLPLYAHAMPLVFNATILNGMGVAGWLAEPPRWRPASPAGALLDVRFTWSDTIWPWTGFLGLYLRVRPEGANVTAIADGEVTFTVVSPPGAGEASERRCECRLPLRVAVVPTPPRERRLLWDQFHNVRYPPGYIPRDSLDVRNDILDWHGDHLHTNYHGLFDALHAAGYFVEILGSPLTCFDALQYGSLLLVDLEDEFHEEEGGGASPHMVASCYWLLRKLLDFTANGTHDPALFAPANQLAAPLGGGALEQALPLPQRRDDVNFTEYSLVLGHDLACGPDAPAQLVGGRGYVPSSFVPGQRKARKDLAAKAALQQQQQQEQEQGQGQGQEGQGQEDQLGGGRNDSGGTGAGGSTGGAGGGSEAAGLAQAAAGNVLNDAVLLAAAFQIPDESLTLRQKVANDIAQVGQVGGGDGAAQGAAAAAAAAAQELRARGERGASTAAKDSTGAAAKLDMTSGALEVDFGRGGGAVRAPAGGDSSSGRAVGGSVQISHAAAEQGKEGLPLTPQVERHSSEHPKLEGEGVAKVKSVADSAQERHAQSMEGANEQIGHIDREEVGVDTAEGARREADEKRPKPAAEQQQPQQQQTVGQAKAGEGKNTNYLVSGWGRRTDEESPAKKKEKEEN
eukprot:jgi/Mesen1/7205/ME000371S06295